METQFRPCLVACGNTSNASLIVLRQKGYELWLEKSENGSLWCAKKGDRSYLAYSGPELLGLVVLWEHLGENWNQQSPDIYGELTEKMEDWGLPRPVRRWRYTGGGGCPRRRPVTPDLTTLRKGNGK